MRASKTLLTLISILVLTCGAVANAFGVTLTVGDAEVNSGLSNSVAIDITVDDPTEIAGAAFTLSYNTQALKLVAVESDFFAPFLDQFSELPGVGTPFVNPQDGKTYVPFTVDTATVYIPAEEIIDGESYSQPLMIGPETATGNAIVAARVMVGEQNQTLFRLTFDVSDAPAGDYNVSIVPTTINNSLAGYSVNGEAVPMLIGALGTGAGQDLTNPATFPNITVEAIHGGTITVTNTDQFAIANKPAEAPTVEAGTNSETFTVTGGDATQYTWTVTDSYGQIIDTHTGNAFTFTAPSAGHFAGVYTVTTTDYQGLSDSFEVKVPMAITPENLSFTEIKLDGSDNPQTIAVTGVDGDYTWEILSSRNAAEAVANPEAYGTWEKSNPVYTDNTNTFAPADIESTQTFFIRVTVDNDTDLSAADGLTSRTVGPFRLIPVDTFTVVLSDNEGVINGTLLETGDITITETNTQQTKSEISYNGETSFLLPDAGGTFHYEVKDTRTQAIYIDQVISSAAKTTYVELTKEGLDKIEGMVWDNFGPVADATVLAYQPSSVTAQHQATTAADGSYVIYLPQGAPLNGWVVVASHNNYVSQQQNEQAAGIVDFTGAYALYAETIIKNIRTTVGESSIQVDITANPPISDVSEIDIMLESGPGSISMPVITDNIDAGSTITIMYDRVHSFSLAIQADTSEDFDPNSGYWAAHLFEYVVNNRTKASSQTKLDKNGGKATLNANNYEADVEIPAGGVTAEEMIVTIEQVQTGSGETSSYVYEITTYDYHTGMELTDSEINYIEITLPLDLAVVNPGDLENGTVIIYHAENLFELEANGGTVVPYTDIISTDYIGDGQTGSVTFSVSHLSVFEVALPGAESAGSSTASSGAWPPNVGCFIATASRSSARDLYVKIYNQLLSAYQRFAE